jgi:insertion element IS1 protein InsB
MQSQTCASNGNVRIAYLCYVQKNYRWVWTSIDREAREYFDFFIGNRGTETGMKLWNKVKEYSFGIVATDYWKSYNEMIPKEQLVQTKAETYTVESYNGQIRHF